MKDKYFAPDNVLLVPSESCPASCSYCFGPHEGQIMSAKTLDDTAIWLSNIWDKKYGKITFHGGEPLCAGYDWFEHALKRLRDTLNHRVRFSIQTNLWILDQRFVDLLAHYAVCFSTSLDGSRIINDRQRGEGYFDKTMNGINLLRKNGITPFVIATVTPENIPEIPNIIEFFVKEHLPFTLRGAVPSFEYGYNKYTIDCSDNARIFDSVFNYNQTSLTPVRIRDINAAAEAVYRKRSGLCTFSNCLGRYAAIVPDGGIFCCQRFSGNEEFRLGSIYDDVKTLTDSKAFELLTALYENNRENCGNCSHFDYCNGGCLYSAAVAKKYGKPLLYCNGEDKTTPYFYKNLFDRINIEIAKEAADNIAGITDGGVYLAAAGATLHPESQRNEEEAIRTAKNWSVNTPPKYAFAYRARADQLYLNVTWNCPLRCSHCAVKATAGNKDMPISDAISVLDGAWELGFRELSINGGEPLVYEHFDELINEMSKKRNPLLIFTLFTSLFPDYDNYVELLKAFDKISVSIDGDEEEHDKRRGKGSYLKTVSNLKKLIAENEKNGHKTSINVRASLTDEQIERGVDKRLKELIYPLGVDRVNISKILPIGRGKNLIGDTKLVSGGRKRYSARFSCGLGTHLHVAPDGKIYPCWAMADKSEAIGNLSEGFKNAAYNYIWGEASEKYRVDRNPKCKDCEVKFLCGGICRAYDERNCKELKNIYM